MQWILRKNVTIVICSIVMSGHLWAQAGSPMLHWSFDLAEDGKVRESVSGSRDTVTGNFRLTRGVKGQATVRDGYTTCIARKASQVPNLNQAFTIEAWIAGVNDIRTE